MGSSYHCFKVNRPIYKVYNMTIPIKLRDPNTKVETKQKILINMDVPIWTVEDVLSWVRRNGFSAFADEFKKCEVDGDLLLSLDENDLKDDLRIDNGITRKRFIRGEAFLKVSLGVNGSGCRTPNFSGNGSYISSNYSYPRSRSDSGRSSPSRLTPLKTYSRMDSTD